MRKRVYLPVIVLLVFLVAMCSTAVAQERDTDTLRVVDTEIAEGDTGSVYIYLRNSEGLGGVSLRVRYDPLVLGPVTTVDDSTVYAAQQRTIDWGIFMAGTDGTGAVRFAGVRYPGQTILDAGGGYVVEFRFFVHEGVMEGTETVIVFEDAPYDTNAYNWLVPWEGTSQYRPKRVSGTITVGAGGTGENTTPMISPVSSPIDTWPGNAVSFTVTAQDADGDQVTLTAYDLPSGALFTPFNPVTDIGTVSGTFGWNPSAQQTGSFIVRFQAHDDKNAYSSYLSVTINVSDVGNPTISPLVSPLSTSQGSLVEFSVTAQDPDGDDLSLTASNLPGGAEFTPSNPVIGTGTVSGTFRWTPNFQQEGLFTVQFQAEDEHSNNSSISSVVIDVDPVVLDELFTSSTEDQSPQGGVPGATGVLIPINFVTTIPTYGVQFDFLYDATVFTVTDIIPTEKLDGFTVYENIGETPGRIKIVTFSLAGNPLGSAGSVIFNVEGTISPAATPGKYELSFEDAWESVNPDPDVPSKMLATTGGHIFVDVLGDANLDTRIDVGDIVSVVGYILRSFDFTQRQFHAANVVVDTTVDVYDLVGIVNMIFGEPVQPAPFNDGEDILAEVVFTYEETGNDAGMYRLVASSPTEIAGIQAEIIYDPLQVELIPPEPFDLATRLDISYKDNKAGRMIVILHYDPTDPATILPSGENEIFGLRIEPGPAGIEGELPPVKLRDVKLCTPEASKILVEGYTEVPRTFELFQNYPNPFNPRTVIEFNLSPQGDEGVAIPTRLDVYNILGQKVATLVDGPLHPGRHAVEWLSTTDAGRPVGSGIYFYKLVAGTQSESKKMVLMK